MKNITINLPHTYVELLDRMGKERGLSRSELLRRAIGGYLNVDIGFKESMNSIFPEIELEIQRRKILGFYNFCITCGCRLHSLNKPYKHKQKFHVMELRFCCDCFKRFEGIKVENFPKLLIEKIQEKLKNFEKMKERLDNLEK